MDFFIRLNAFFGGFGFGLGTEAADDTRWYQFGAIGKNTIRFSERISFCEYVDKRLSYFIPLCKYFLQPKSDESRNHPNPCRNATIFFGFYGFIHLVPGILWKQITGSKFFQ